MMGGDLLTSVYTSLTFRTYVCVSFHQIIFKHGNFTFKGTRFSRVDGFCVNCSGQKLNKVKHFQTLNYKQTFQGTNFLFTGSKGRVCKFSLVNCDPLCLFSFVVIYLDNGNCLSGFRLQRTLVIEKCSNKNFNY